MFSLVRVCHFSILTLKCRSTKIAKYHSNILNDYIYIIFHYDCNRTVDVNLISFFFGYISLRLFIYLFISLFSLLCLKKKKVKKLKSRAYSKQQNTYSHGLRYAHDPDERCRQLHKVLMGMAWLDSVHGGGRTL